jgi:aminoglycoside 2''-phosphotransferase
MEFRGVSSEIESCFPDIRVANCRRITTGWENSVVEINGDYIFRFPRLKGRWTRMQEEIALLRWLSRVLTVSVPKYEFVWQGNRKHPRRLAGYRKIAGVPISRQALRHGWADRLGRDLGGFLSELHGLRLPGEILEMIPTYDQKSWAEGQTRFHRRARRYVYPLLDAETRSRAEAFWTDFLERSSKVEFAPVLIHSDLTSGNIIVDPSTGRLNGVIDWGDAKVGDPAVDFVGLFELSRLLGEITLTNYRRTKKEFKERVELYLLSASFGEVAWGVQAGVKRSTLVGLKHIRERLV